VGPDQQLAAGSDDRQVARFFADGAYQTSGEIAITGGEPVGGVYVLDAKNAEHHLVTRDPHQVGVFQQHEQHILQGRLLGDPHGTFKAPPADVRQVPVMIPKTPLISGGTSLRHPSGHPSWSRT
jgi:hypothetical protein